MTTFFHVTLHSIPACHIREYPRATADDQEDALSLVIKQYTPRNRSAASNAITIIGAHANGFPKIVCQELYEPLWDDLHQSLAKKDIPIAGIWIADVAHQGASGVLNEGKLGDDPSWADHPRDLFLMINHFRRHMRRPLVGIGHSMGGNNIVNLSIVHPRLFASVILVDPVIQRYMTTTGDAAKASTVRRDMWPSRQAAADTMQASKFYRTWDPRVFDRWTQHGLRDLPTYHHPDTMLKPSAIVSADPTSVLQPSPPSAPPVTLTTTKDQEVLTFFRANLPTVHHPDPGRRPNPLTHPDVDPDASPSSPFYNPTATSTFHKLPFLRPSTLYIFGDPSLSPLSSPLTRADKLANTGTGVGGSGGVRQGRVAYTVFDGVGHLIPMQAVEKTAEACASWIAPEIERWRRIEDAERAEWSQVAPREKALLKDEYKRAMLGEFDGAAWEKRRQATSSAKL